MRMQCKDILDRPILEFIAGWKGEWTFTHGGADEVRWVGNVMPYGVPDKLLRAKMGMLIRRDLVSGCTCGCRGDYTLTEKGWELLSFMEGAEVLV